MSIDSASVVSGALLQESLTDQVIDHFGHLVADGTRVDPVSRSEDFHCLGHRVRAVAEAPDVASRAIEDYDGFGGWRVNTHLAVDFGGDCGRRPPDSRFFPIHHQSIKARISGSPWPDC